MKASRLSLRHRLLLTVLLPVALLLALLVGVSLVRGERMTETAIAERGLAIVSFLAPAAEYGVISGNSEILDSVLGALRLQKDVVAAVLYDREGAVIAQRGEPQVLDVAQVLGAAQAVRLQQGAGRKGFAAPVLTVPLVVNELDVATPADDKMPVPVGWVYVEIDTSGHESAWRTTQVATIALALATLLMTAVLAGRLARSVGEPVARLVDAVRRMAGGELEVQVTDQASSEELRELQQGFNSMARSIANAHKTLQDRIDEATARLAHQALHDPLTALPNRRAFERVLEENGVFTREEISAVEAEDSRIDVLYINAGVGGFDWSPDGSRIAYTARVVEPGRYGLCSAFGTAGRCTWVVVEHGTEQVLDAVAIAGGSTGAP